MKKQTWKTRFPGNGKDGDNTLRLWEYRIRYKADNAVENNYHYYQATCAKQAFEFQTEMAEHKRWHIDTLSIERKCPYSDRWIDETHAIK